MGGLRSKINSTPQILIALECNFNFPPGVCFIVERPDLQDNSQIQMHIFTNILILRFSLH